MRGTLLSLCALAACAVNESSEPAANHSQIDEPITNGAADAGDPQVVALVDPADRVLCTATVIGPHTAITAAHCFLGPAPRTLRVFFGSTIAGGGTFTPVADARSHPSFDAATLAHDIALLTFRDDSPVAPLGFDTRTIDASLVGTSFRVVGFGTTSNTSGDSGDKREGVAKVSDVQAEEFTALPSPSQPCRGDSGGPALFGTQTIAAVVSRGDAACSDHAVYARIDTARAALVDPYLADTAPGTAHTGDACFYSGHCAEGPCLQTHDDPLLYFCSQPCARDADCPAAMECASDGCRYPEPSPGAIGATCEQDAQCTIATCRESVCTLGCLLDPNVCPAGFECRPSGTSQYCFAKPDDTCGGCSSSSPTAAGLLVLLGFARRRRRVRSRQYISHMR
ncbi:MAG TPA: trypsin-like serine protease [Kofleriaceae bacterium]